MPRLPHPTRRLLALLVTLLVLTLFGAPAGYTQASEPTVLTLPLALELARENSERIRQAEADLRRAELGTREVQANRLPNVSVGGQYTNNIQTPVIFLPEDSPFGGAIRTGAQHNMNLNLQASLPLFNPQLNRTVELQRAAENLNQLILEVTQREVEVEVHRAFVNGLMAAEALNVLEASFETRERNLALVASLHAEGMVPEYDLLRTEVQVQNMQPDVVRAQNQLQGALNYVKLLTGLPVGQPIALDGSLPDFYATLPTFSFEPDFATNPAVIQLEGQRQIAQQQIALERAAYLPSLSAFGNYASQAQGEHLRAYDYNWVSSSAVGLSLSIPLFDGFARRHRVQQAQIAREQVEWQQEFLMEQLATQFETTASNITAIEATIEAQQRNVSQAERSLSIARVSYEEGVHSLVEVNDAELALTQARLNYVNALYDYVNAVLDMEDLLGRSMAGA